MSTGYNVLPAKSGITLTHAYHVPSCYFESRKAWHCNQCMYFYVAMTCVHVDKTKTVTFVLVKMFKSLLASYFLTFMRMRYTVKRTSLIWIGSSKNVPISDRYLFGECNFIVTTYSKRN